MKRVTLLLLSVTSILLARCASDTMNSDDMKGMDHGDANNMSAHDHANMRM